LIFKAQGSFSYLLNVGSAEKISGIYAFFEIIFIQMQKDIRLFWEGCDSTE
jgi:hypothetical protein